MLEKCHSGWLNVKSAVFDVVLHFGLHSQDPARGGDGDDAVVDFVVGGGFVVVVVVCSCYDGSGAK